MSTQPLSNQPRPMDFESKSMRRNTALRSATNYFVSGLCILATVLVILPLIAILFYLIYKGASSLNLAFFTHIPAPVGEEGGGMANSIVGSGIVLFLASLMGIPIGIAAGVYLAEFGRGKTLATAVRFTADVLNGVPSIVMGISIYSLIVVQQKHFSALAGGVALAIMMVPTITRTTEEMLATVPHAIREAALGLGVPKWRTAISVSLRTASPGIITGCMLAFARVAGETAPLLFTAFGNQFWSFKLSEPIAALPLQIYVYAISPYDEWHRLAWAGLARSYRLNHGLGHARPHLCQPRRTQGRKLVGVGILVEDLNAWYGTTHTLQDINLHIPANHATALIGPSGCGKSTFVRCLNRMHETNPIARATGIVKMGDIDIYSDASPVEIRRRVGMVFQRPNPFPTMSIYDNVVSGLKLNGFRNRRILDETVERSLKQAALWEEVKDDLKKKSGASLSGGQQQRMCIARAARSRSRGSPDGRARLRAGPRLHLQDRRSHLSAQEPVHHRHRDAQHAASRPRCGEHRLFPQR
ncbi:phosphate ABC transporter permease PstA [Tunturiibacter empetritectus]|uniref:phosphate ABC transporter permease PstA n=1 Tax=Tunturiibacter empetritectus TaxID=3069691 RepID=UPI003D9BBE6A